MRAMMAMVMCLTAIVGCGDEPPLSPLRGGHYDVAEIDPGCDPWTDVECCKSSETYCPDTHCIVHQRLCGGSCVGVPNPMHPVDCHGAETGAGGGGGGGQGGGGAGD